MRLEEMRAWLAAPWLELQDATSCEGRGERLFRVQGNVRDRRALPRSRLSLDYKSEDGRGKKWKGSVRRGRREGTGGKRSHWGCRAVVDLVT